MATNVDTQVVRSTQPPVRIAIAPRPVVAPNPPSPLSLPTLNQAESARFQPKTSTTPPYSPDQPDSVKESQSNAKVQDRQNAAAIKTQQDQQQVQMANQHLASNLLTGEYNAKAVQRQGTAQVGGYISLSV